MSSHWAQSSHTKKQRSGQLCCWWYCKLSKGLEISKFSDGLGKCEGHLISRKSISKPFKYLSIYHKAISPSRHSTVLKLHSICICMRPKHEFFTLQIIVIRHSDDYYYFSWTPQCLAISMLSITSRSVSKNLSQVLQEPPSLWSCTVFAFLPQRENKTIKGILSASINSDYLWRNIPHKCLIKVSLLWLSNNWRGEKKLNSGRTKAMKITIIAFLK